jgi:hypothetical protein
MRGRIGAAALLGTGLATGLAGCATTPASFPIEVSRFHYDPVVSRGTVTVEPMPEAQNGPEFADYAAAVTAELTKLGYTPATPGAKPDNVVNVGFTRATRPLPPRRSPVTIGIGGGGYSGGYGGGGGVGGGVSFPVGGRGVREGVVTELTVRLRRGPDATWEGRARTVTDVTRPEATSAAVAQRLATALFAGFPGESGRTTIVP